MDDKPSEYTIKVTSDDQGQVKLESTINEGQTISALVLSAISAMQKDHPNLTQKDFLAFCNGMWQYDQEQ